MKQSFNNINGVIKKSLRFLFLILLIQSQSFSQDNSQSISNMDVFYNLVDSASNSLIKDLGNTKNIKLDLNLGIDYNVFANKIRANLIKNGFTILNENSNEPNFETVNFVLDNSDVEYSEPEKDGLFGDYFTQRKIELSGNYFLSNKSLQKELKFASVDTINVEDVDNLETRSYPFTKGDLPPEPFFSSILEPIVAVGAAALSVILFFSVRSK